MSKKVTVYNIAEKLGISAGTVSRVLNNSSLISNEKSELILKTSKEMGYTKRSIKRPGSRAILNIILFLPCSEEPQYHVFYDPALLISGLKTGFGNTKANMITELNGEISSVLDSKKIGDIDGAVFAFTDPSSQIIALLEDRQISFLVLNRKEEKLNYISLDNKGAMDKLFSRVLKVRPVVKPFYLGLKTADRVNSIRKKAFLDSCKNNVISEYKMLDLNSFDEITTDLLKSIQIDGYNWLACFNDIVAVSVLSSAVSAGIKIPEDISLTGFDNSPIRNIFSRKISTIDLEVRKMGEEAGKWLYGTIIDKEKKYIHEELPFRFIDGDTIGSTK